MSLLGLTVGAILSIQALYLWRSLQSGRRALGGGMDEVRKDSRRDLEARAARGEAPDWLRYLDDADRSVLPSLDRVRNLATAALATGVGGTIVALLVELWTNSELRRALAGGPDALSSFDSLPSLVAWALFVSVAGVVNHLLILVLVIPRLDRQIVIALRDFRVHLEAASEARPPRQAFVDSVRSELSTAFNSALQSIPDVFARFGENVEELRASSVALAESARDIGPVAASLAGATEEIRVLPEELATVLSETRESWRAEIFVDQQKHLEGLRAVLAEQQELVQSLSRNITSRMEDLPRLFSDHAEAATTTMSEALGLRISNLVNDLVGAVKSGHESLAEHSQENVAALNRTFLNGTAEVVREAVDSAVASVYEHPIFGTLDSVGRGLNEAIVELPGQASSFSESLVAADAKLRTALDGIEAAGDQLQRVALNTGEIENALSAATQQSLEPLQEELTAFAADLRFTHQQMNEHSDGLVVFIQNLITRLERQDLES